MQGIWNVAPWMRRRAQRHIERGGSTRVLRYILTTPGTEMVIPEKPPQKSGESAAPNVILFRALKACS